MKEFEASATIDAPAQVIWGVLLDTPRWPEWDPFCVEIEGTVELGAKLKAWSKLDPKRGFCVKVTELTPNRKMVWSGGMPLGLFKGVRSYTLTPEGDRTGFTPHEVFSGPMSGLIPLPDMSEAFRAYVQGLKERAEATASR